MRLGLEHEYQLTDRDGILVDYRTIIDRAMAHGWRVDPVDPLARRVAGGGLVTADGVEAELATPPVECGPAMLDVLERHVAEGVSHISGGLPDGVSMHGFSTHVNVECTRREVASAARVVKEWSPLLMAFTQWSSSPGLLVRPRWRRLEFGADHLAGPSLRAALVVAVSVVAAVAAGDRLPAVEWPALPSRQRFGWFVDREAAIGSGRVRSAPVRRAGTTVSFQSVLDEAWPAARRHVDRLFEPADLGAVDAAIAGDTPLAVEIESETVLPVPSATTAGARLLSRSTYRLEVWPHEISWRRAVFTVASPDGVHWVSIDGLALPSFLDDLHAGRLDDALRAGCRRGRRSRALAAAGATR